MTFEKLVMEEALDAIIDYRGRTPQKSPIGIPTLSAKSVKNGQIDYSECYYISPEEYKKFMTRGFPQKGDILLTTEAPLGMVAKLDRADVAVAQRLLTLRGKKGVLDNDFLMYYLQSSEGQGLLKAKETGTTVTGIKQAEFRKIVIKVPDFQTQKKIAAILSALDEKIAINRAINDNLLEQIKTICTAWLSDYKPFDGVMPSDWVETPLSDIAEFISGYSYKGTELTNSTIAMATIKNFDRKGGFKLDGYKEIIPSSKLKESQHAELFDTLVAHTDLTQNAEVIGNAEPVMSKSEYDDIVFSMDLVKVLPKKDGVSKFLIAAILQDKKFKAHCLGYVNGTTVLHLSKKALPEYKLFLPSDFSTLKPLDEVVTALYKQVSSNISENTYLEELREALLPKLMSGEIDVSTVQF